MLVVSRRADESIQIKLADGVDGNLTLNDLFAKGPIAITLLGGNGRRVKMGIEAPPELCILRVEKPGADQP
jgi:sRNA-binding carbon storage regulator CsrA